LATRYVISPLAIGYVTSKTRRPAILLPSILQQPILSLMEREIPLKGAWSQHAAVHRHDSGSVLSYIV